jgi:hypothetical protein
VIFNNFVAAGAVWLLVPKAGNSSIKKALCRALGLDEYPDALHRHWNYLSPSEIVNVDPALPRIAVVRNPYDRLASCWWQKLHRGGASRLPSMGFRRGMMFREFLEVAAAFADDEADQHFRAQAYGMTCDGRFLPNFVARLETLTDDWDELRSEFFLDLPDLSRENRSDPPDVQTPETRAMIAERWRADFRLLGYPEATCET